MKTVHQSLTRDEQRTAFRKLMAHGLHAQMLFDPSLSGRTATIFLVQVPEIEVERAKSILAGVAS